MFWTTHGRAAIEFLLPGVQQCVKQGDFVAASYCSGHTWVNSLIAGTPFPELLQLRDRFDGILVSSARSMHDTFMGMLAHALRELTDVLGGNDGDDVDSRIERTPSALVGLYYILKCQSQFIMGNRRGALEAAAEAEKHLWAHLTWAGESEYWYYFALTLASNYAYVSEDEQQQYLKSIETALHLLKEWSDNCPDNFFNQFALVSAELARLRGEDAEAIKLYEQAIQSAGHYGAVHKEAIANELAAAFYRSRGIEAAARAYLKQSRACYSRWGAELKVAQLDALHPALEEIKPSSRSLDMMAIFKAAEAISQEVVFDQLLMTLMNVVIQSSGAQHAVLVLQEQGELVVRAHTNKDLQSERELYSVGCAENHG